MRSLVQPFEAHDVGRPHPMPARASVAPPEYAGARIISIDTARMAVRSLYDELALYPKPGLVSPVDSGSHHDMNAQTFLRSLFALRHYFIAITQAGIEAAPFDQMKRLGIAAERRMLGATGGINTHRGAIFCIGLLCAAIGYCRARRLESSAKNIRSALLSQWGDALTAHTRAAGVSSHGLDVAALHAASGAREEAALGFPSVFEIALPALRATYRRTGCWEQARIDALFSLMAHVSDTNVYYRGGIDGARLVRDAARAFLACGGTAQPDWKIETIKCHRLFVRHKLSPGGAADLLAATCLLHQATMQGDPR